MPIDLEALIRELTELRQGAGLTQQSIMLAPEVLAALGNPQPAEAIKMLKSTITGLGESEPALVTRRAFAIDVSSPDVLTKRRRDYQEQTGRDIKTIIRYEDRMIRQLAALLVKGGEHGRLMVGAWVVDRTLDYVRVEFDDDLPFEVEIERAYKYSVKRPSIPLFLYTLPTSYAPPHMVVSILFKTEQPVEVWPIMTADLFEVSSSRYERRMVDTTGRSPWKYVDYDRPQIGHYYGFGWRWPD